MKNIPFIAKKKNRGFTLVELMVSIAIFTVITSVAVYNNAQFNGSVLLTNLTYEIALSIRQAQFYGIVVKQTSDFRFDSGYGIRINSASPMSYILFEDQNPQNHVFDAPETLESFSIKKGNKISRVCLDGNCGNSIVDITFTRPNPDAYITAGGISSVFYGKAEICVKSPQGLYRKATVESTGQISVGMDTAGICNGS